MGYSVVKIGMEVADMEQSLAFYHGILKMPILERFPREDGGENIFLDAGNVILELMSSEHPVPGNFHHIAIGTKDTEREAEELSKKGCELIMDPIVVEENIHLADLRDPDGIRVRMFHREA